MHKFLWSLLLLPFSVIAQQKFVITGKLTGLPEGTQVSLSDPNKPGDTLAQAEVLNGVFSLQGKVAEPNLYQISFGRPQQKSVLFIGNDRVNISGRADSLQQIKVSGSPIHDDFETFKQTFNPLFFELKEMVDGLNARSNLDKSDPGMQAYEAHLQKIREKVDQFVTARPSSPVAPFVMMVTSEIEPDISVVERRYNGLGSPARSSFFGKLVKEYIDHSKIGSIGSEAVDFSQADPDGKMISLRSFRGKYVLVDFWASWCKPCRMENPNVVKAYHTFKGKNFTVLGVSLDNNRQNWLKAIEADKLHWPQVSDLKGWGNQAAALYGIQAIPQNILVDPAGKIIDKNLRGADLQRRLTELLGK